MNKNRVAKELHGFFILPKPGLAALVNIQSLKKSYFIMYHRLAGEKISEREPIERSRDTIKFHSFTAKHALQPQSKKILIVAESINVEDSSGSKANVALIENIRQLGYSLKVYHYTRKEVLLPGIECISIPEKKFNTLYLLSRAQRKIQHYFNCNLAKYLEPVFGFSFTFFNDTQSIAKALQKDQFQPDIVLTLSKGASYRPHYALLAVPKLHKKWMAYMHDPYPFYLYPRPYNWEDPGYPKKIHFFKEVAKKCRWAAYPSELLKQWMEKDFPGFKQKGLVIPHQYNLEDLKQVVLPSYFNTRNFKLLHAGNLMKQRNPEGLLLGFQKFLERNPKAKETSKLLFIGAASYHRRMLEEYKNKTEQLYVSPGYVSYPQVLKMQQEADVNIILEAIAPESPFLPGKFPHCVFADNPIFLVGPGKSESRRLLGTAHPYWAKADDAEKIAENIEILYKNWKKGKKQQLGREDLKQYLSKEFLKQQLDSVLS